MVIVIISFIQPTNIQISPLLFRVAGVGSSNSTVINPHQLTFVYPYGSTLNVVQPAVPVLTSGFVSYPLNRPISAFWSKRVSN